MSQATPLSVQLTSITPAQIPRTGVITLSGVVRNDSDEDWTDVNVTPFLSSTPITTRDGLVEAAQSPEDQAVGERLTDSGTYAALGDLAPAATAAFNLRVPVTSLEISGDSGVYWIGVHALATGDEGRDLVADGRVRTFIPLVSQAEARRRTVPVSVVLPLRQSVRRAPDGSLDEPADWASLVGSDGRLSRLVDFGASAGEAPLAWLLDPAVLDALEDLAHGNPPLSLGATHRPGEDPDGGPAKKPTERGSARVTTVPEPSTPSAEERKQAKDLLDRFVESGRAQQLLTLGYADPDVASLARHQPSLLPRADLLAASRMKARGLDGTPTVAPPQGYFDPELLSEIPRKTRVLLSDAGDLTSPPSARLPSGQELLLTDARAGSGGPAPTDELDPLALRQRILSEAALEVAKGAQPARPVVVALPNTWDPGAEWRTADFFGGLQTPWVRLSPLRGGSITPYSGELAYSPAQRRLEISSRNVAVTSTVVRTGDLLDDLLANENDVEERLTGAALTASGYHARRRPRLAREQALALNSATRAQMDRVSVTGTDFVTLSGGAGTLTVTIVNDLEQPITVGLRASSDAEVEVETPRPVSMKAGQRITLRLQVTSGVGVHAVTIYPVTEAGDRVGSALTFNLRTSQVGRLIWYIILAAGLLLTVMVLRRIVLRIRNHRWREEETP